MSRFGITFENVYAAAETILAQGENPTIEKIRRELGTGSNSTIAKYLHEWRSNRLIASTNHLSATQNTPDPVHMAVNQVWEKIRLESDSEMKAYQAEAKKHIDEANEERTIALKLKEDLQVEFENLQKRFHQLSSDKELLTLDLKALQLQKLQLEEKYLGLENQYHLFKQETHNQIVLLQSINKKESEDKEATLTALQSSHDNAINKIIETQENYRQQHLLEIDSYKTEYTKQQHRIDKLMTEIQQVKSELIASKGDIQLILLERDAARHDAHEKNHLLEKNNHLSEKIGIILEKIEHLRDLENLKTITNTLFHLNTKITSQENTLTLLLNLLNDEKETT